MAANCLEAHEAQCRKTPRKPELTLNADAAGWEAGEPPDPAQTNNGCPILGASLFLRQGWNTTNPPHLIWPDRPSALKGHDFSRAVIEVE